MNSRGLNSMSARLERVLVCRPREAGWADPARATRWSELGYLREPDPDAAEQQHAALRRVLEETGAEVVTLPDSAELTLDAVYTHDASLTTAWGAILLNTGKPTRRGEAPRHADVYASLGVPVIGELTSPAVAEAGDMVWLDQSTLLVGRGYRTDRQGVEQLRALLASRDVELLEAPLVHGRGPQYCLHLMSIMSVLDERTVLVDLERLAVASVELLEERGFRLVEIDAAERDSLACNVLALGDGGLLAIEQNTATNRRLERAGFRVRTFPGGEICLNGSGGPTCLTRPLRRRAG